MPDKEKVFDAFRNCITEPKCKDCPWEQCEQFNQKKVTIPVTLAIDVLNLLKERLSKVEMKMLQCEGYKMFHGTVLVSPVIREDGTRWREPFDLTGTWLYRPDVDTWYCTPDDGGMTKSWVPAILSNFRIHY